MAVRAPGGAPILSVGRQGTGKLQTWNNITSQSTVSTTTVTLDEWHHLELRVAVAGPDSTVEVWLDGTRIDDLSATVDLGTNPVDQVLVGDTQSGRTFDLLFDDVEAEVPSDRSFLWDVARPLPELAVERGETGGLKSRYLYGRDLIQMTTGGSDYTYHHDALG